MQISNWCSDLCCGEVLAIGTEKISGEGKYLVRAGEEQQGRKRRKIFGEGKYIIQWHAILVQYYMGVGGLMSCNVMEKEEKYLKRKNILHLRC